MVICIVIEEVWIPKIDIATQPFLGLIDMRHGTFLKSPW